ncbi:MAG: tetratricopeptide repeat protein [Acidobacteriota bacterium]
MSNAVTREMVQWARRSVPKRATDEARFTALIEALLDHGMREVEGPTEAAPVAFADRRANCVSMAHLVVGLARRLKIPAYFVLLRAPPLVEKRGDLRVVNGHLAAAVGPLESPTVGDFVGTTSISTVPLAPGEEAVASGEAVTPTLPLAPVSDATAGAIFELNLGAERLLARDVEGAVRHLGAAVALDPEFEQAWLNLGVALRRSGNRGAAAGAYRRALVLNPDLLAARQNLALLETTPSEISGP